METVLTGLMYSKEPNLQLVEGNQYLVEVEIYNVKSTVCWEIFSEILTYSGLDINVCPIVRYQ